MTNPFSFLTTKVVFGGMLAIIIVLGGVIVTPVLTLNVATVKLMIDDAVKCSTAATAAEITKITTATSAEFLKVRQEKLDVDTYVADQRRVTEAEESIKKSVEKMDGKLDWLIRLQVGSKKAADIDRQNTKDYREHSK